MAMRYYAPFPGGSGEPQRPPGPHGLRIGDAEREAAATDLGEHYAAGRLTLDELNERLDAVFSAKTLGQLSRVMTDLPGPGRLSWRTGPYEAPPRPVRRARGFQEEQSGSGDRKSGLAALSLLLLAMLIWLFTALLFAGHGFYHPGPYGYGQNGYTHTMQYDGSQSPSAP